MMTTDDYRNLIAVVQGDDDIAAGIATTDIIIDIIENHMDKHLWKYYSKNTTGGIDKEDIRQIFLIGVSMAIESARTDIGDPLLYLIQKGKWAVVDELRRGYRKAIRQYCHKCSKETRVFEKAGIAICPTCGGEDVIRVMVDTLDDGEQTVGVEAGELLLDTMVTSQVLVDQFKSTLSGRTLDVFEMIMDKGYDRDSCTNYIKEIAGILGVTPANVNKRLRRIKEEWIAFGQVFDEIAATNDKPNEEGN